MKKWLVKVLWKTRLGDWLGDIGAEIRYLEMRELRVQIFGEDGLTDAEAMTMRD